MKTTRKILSVLLLVMLVSQCMIGLTSCKDPVECQHTEWNDWAVSTAATCTAAGVRTRTCKGCDETQTEAIAALGHSFTKYASDSNATCIANMTETATCDRCTAKDTREVADSKNASVHASDEVHYHKNAADATKHDKLYACCEALIETQEHTYDAGVADGDVMVYTCTLCKATNRVAPEGHTHNATFVAAKAASCTETGNVAHWYCEGCRTYFSDEALTQQLTQAEVVLPATHVFEFYQTVAPKCDQVGGDQYKCECGATKMENEVSATGHSVEFWSFVSETPKDGAACTFVQTYEGTCFLCNTLQTKTNEIVRHRFVATVTVHSTCQSAGNKHYECACGATPEDPDVAIPVAPNAHSWDAGVTEGNVTTYTCQACQGTKTALVSTATDMTVNAGDLADNDVVLDGVSLRLDSTTLSLLDGEVSVSAAPVENRDELIATIPEALRGQITADTPIYDFSLSANGEPISDFGGGSITITLPYTLPAGADADCVAVCYVADDGTVTFYEATYYEMNGEGFVAFEAAHFSAYLPTVVPEENACELYGHNEIGTTVAPTCTATGYTEYHCQRCGNARMGDTVSSLGHAYDAGVSTEASCTVPGTVTYTCTRTDCGHRMSMELTVPHKWNYIREKSKEANCVEDGYMFYECEVCHTTKQEEQPAYGGSHQMEIVSVALAQGSTSCTDGVVASMRCHCGATETKTVYEHTPYDKYTDEGGNYLIPGEETINLGEYLTQAGVQYMEAPVITMTHGCLCGEMKGEIRMSNGMGMYGGELFTGWFDGFWSQQAPQNPEYCRTVLMQTQSEMAWDPMLQMPVEGPVFKVQFKEILEIDGCHYTYSVEIKIGYNEETGEAVRTETFLMSEWDFHIIKTTATVKDPTKSCYDNCLDEDGQYYCGITVTDTCKNCGELIRTFEDAVRTSSSHYWYSSGEGYEYADEDCPNGYYGVRVSFKTCPCGLTDYVLHTGDCSFDRQTVGDFTVYTCRDCGYIYAEKQVTLDDRENCRHTETKYLYLGCESAENLTDCEKAVVCVLDDYEMHYETEAQTNNTPTEYPCTTHIYNPTVCTVCGHEIHVFEGYLKLHDLLTTQSTDLYGNVTVTEACKTEGCGYLHITVTDPNGEILREYTEDKDYDRGVKLISLATYKMVWGEIRPMSERNEYYDLESGELQSWYQMTYTYQSIPTLGCIALVTYMNHLGETEQSGDMCCELGEPEHQDRTCLQDGYDRQTCTRCGAVQEMWFEHGGHSFDLRSYIPTASGREVQYLTCTMCGVCVTDDYPHHPLNVMPWYEGGDQMTVKYRNPEGSTATGIDATYSFKVYAYDMDGRLVDNMETQEIYTLTLDGIAVTDDGEGTLSFSTEEIVTAMGNETLNREYQYFVCFVIEADGQGPIYIQIPVYIQVPMY